MKKLDTASIRKIMRERAKLAPQTRPVEAIAEMIEEDERKYLKGRVKA